MEDSKNYLKKKMLSLMNAMLSAKYAMCAQKYYIMHKNAMNAMLYTKCYIKH